MTSTDKHFSIIHTSWLTSFIVTSIFSLSLNQYTMAQTSGEAANPSIKTSNDETSANKELIRKGFAGWTAGTFNFFDLLDDNMEWTITGTTPLSKTYKSKKQFIGEVIGPLNERFSKKIVPTVRGIYGDGDMVIALWDGVATATDGKPYLSSYSWFMQLRAGKIVKVVAFLDGMEFTDIMTRIPPSK